MTKSADGPFDTKRLQRKRLNVRRSPGSLAKVLNVNLSQVHAANVRAKKDQTTSNFKSIVPANANVGP